MSAEVGSDGDTLKDELTILSLKNGVFTMSLSLNPGGVLSLLGVLRNDDSLDIDSRSGSSHLADVEEEVLVSPGVKFSRH